MKKFSFFAISLLFLISAGCSNDAELKTFINERSDLVTKMATIIDANPTSAGIDEAQKLFDSKKAELQAKYEVVNQSKKSSDGLSMWFKSKLFDMDMLKNVGEKHRDKITYGSEADSKLNKLISDYVQTFK
jgi:hypothetical protein